MPPSDSRSRDRPEKLRKACNLCNAAKVRCSGERSGCQRCRDANSQCVFEESRIGRVPGIRARKLKAQRPESLDGHPGWSTSQLGGQPRTPVTTGVEISPQAAQSSIHSWPISQPYPIGHPPPFEDPNILAHAFEASGALPANSRSGMSESLERDSWSLQTDMFEPNEFSFDSASPTYTSTTSQSLALPESNSWSASKQAAARQGESKLDSRRVMACCQILSTLERYIDEDVHALEIMLGGIQSTVQAVSQLVSLQEPCAPRCFHLFHAIVEQVISLLENACSDLEAGHGAASAQPSQSARSSSLSSVMTAFKFGNFLFDATEQCAARTQAARKELRNIQALHQRIVALGAASGLVSQRTGPASVDARIRSLALKLGRSENG